MSQLHHEDKATKYPKLALLQLHESPSQISLNWKLLIKQFDRLLQSLVRFAETTQEPKVTWKRDRQGRSYFEIYDPVAEKYHYADSEQEVRVWFERLRYPQPAEKRRQLHDEALRSDYFRRHW